MAKKYNFISVDTLLAKFARELKETTINEGDIIEWIGEALSFMKVISQNEEAVAILKVNNYTAELPSPIKYLTQVAKLNNHNNYDCNCCSIETEEFIEEGCDCEESCYQDFNESNEYIIPGTYTAKYSYLDFYRSFKRNKIEPMKLANGAFFNSLVCRELDNEISSYYNNCEHQYSIVGTSGLNAIRTSFKEGWVAVAYVRTPTDEETGYPLIPDEPNHIQAINYFVRWKIAESLAWVGREGFANIAIQSEERWLKYIRQANNTAKMPSGAADYEDLKNQSLYLIPKTNKYNNYFGTINKRENLRF